MNTLFASHGVPRARERGAVLVVAMLMLLVLTIVALAASQTTRLQEKMAWNARDTDLAFQASEAALRAAELYLTNTSSPRTCSDPTAALCYVLQEGQFIETDLARQDKDWWLENSKGYSTVVSETIPAVTEEPRFVIEEQQTVPFSLTVGHGVPPGKTYYKSTAWSHGGTEASNAITESVFARE